MVASRSIVLAICALVLVPAPLAAAKDLSLVPGAVDALKARVADPLPVALDAPARGGLVRLPGPGDETVALHVGLPTAARNGSLLLGFPAPVRVKLDPALLDLAPLVKEGVVREDGLVPVLVRHRVPLTTDVLDVTLAFARFDLLAGRVPLADLPTLALDPAVERVFLDGGNRPDLSASVPHIRADQVHNRTDAAGRPVTGVGVTIAILDTGVDHTHPDLGGCLGAGCKVVEARSFTDDPLDASDDYGHGTHVAATAAGVHGVAPGASLLNYKVLENGWGWDSWIIAGIENATAAGADVISMSLGGWGATDTPLALAVDWAVAQGVVVVSAAGNSGCYGCVGEPATSLSGIAVGATGRDNDQLAWFSSRGPVFDSAGDIAGIKPDLVAPGVGIVAAVPTGSCPLCDPSGYLSLSGTSMATPHVSGVAALLLQAHPAWTPDDVKGALMGSAVDIAPASFASDSRSQGTGRVDALAAHDARVSVLPGNGFLGIDLAGEPGWSVDWPVQVKNLGNATLDLDLDATLRVFSPGDPAAGAPDWTWAPEAVVDGGSPSSDPYANVTAGGPLGRGHSYDLTLTNLTLASGPVTLYAPDGTMWTQASGSPDGAHAGRSNATFGALYLPHEGVWRAVGDGVDARFGVGGIDVATQNVTSLALAAGASATVLVNVTVDNAKASDGWHEGVVTVAGDAAARAKMTFVKSGILRLILHEDTWFAFVQGSTGFFDSVSGGGNVTLLAPSGSYDFQVAVLGCPANATDCDAWSSFQFHFVEDVEHVSDTTVDLRPPADMNRLAVVPRLADGSVLPSTVPYCNWGDTTGACYESGNLLFSTNASWMMFGISLGNALAPAYVSDTTWNVGRDLVYYDGDQYLITGDARVGLTEDLVIDPASFEERAFRYESPPGAEPALRVRYCWLPFGWGFGNGRHMGSGETLLWGVPALPRFMVGGGWEVTGMTCQNLEMYHVVSDVGLRGTQCFNVAGCYGAWASAIQRWLDGAFQQHRGIWSSTPLDVGLADGAIAVQEGASYYAGSPYAIPGEVWLYPDWDALSWNQHFAPASGGSQDLWQAFSHRQTATLALDGTIVATRTLGQDGTVVAMAYAGPGELTLTVATNGSLVAGEVGNATYEAVFPSSWSSGYLPTLSNVHLTDAGGLETVFDAADPPTLRFREDLGWVSGTLQNVSVSVTNLDTGAGVATCCATGTDGAYAIPLPTLGAGRHALAVTAEAPGGVRIALTQSPAFVMTEANNTAPRVAIDSPQSGDVVSGVVPVSGRAWDADGNETVQAVEVRVAGGAWRPANGTTSWTYEFNSDAYPEGSLLIEARAFDGAAYSAIHSANVTVQRESPNQAPVVVIDAPTDGEAVWGWITLAGTASDADGNETLVAVELSIDGGAWFAANGTTAWSSPLDTTTLADGWHVLTARASDGQTTSVEDVAWFFVDNVVEPPCLVDLVVTSVTVERAPIETRLGAVDNDVAGRHTVRAVVQNAGECDAFGVTVDAAARASARVPGTTGGVGTTERIGHAFVDHLAPGASVEVEMEWDAFGNVGDQVVTIEVDRAGVVTETDESNNARSVRAWFLVGGLGGVALPTLPAPFVDL